MKRIRINPTLAVACVALVVALGGTAYAAGAGHMIIQSGSSSNAATVSKANQLLTGAAPLNQYVNAFSSAVEGSCQHMYTVPAGKALVLQNATFTLAPASTGIVEGDIYTFGCNSFAYVYALGSAAVGATTVEVDGGNRIFSAGTTLYFDPTGQAGSKATVLLHGYLVPSAAAAGATGVHAIGLSKRSTR